MNYGCVYDVHEQPRSKNKSQAIDPAVVHSQSFQTNFIDYKNADYNWHLYLLMLLL